MSTPIVDELTALLEPLAEQHGLELVAVETAGGSRAMTIRIYLDREGGIDIEAIASSNAWIAEALDGVRALSGRYTLEVSSPGIDRILRTVRDYERFAGQRASVHTDSPIDGRSRFTGTILGVEGDVVLLEIDDTTVRVPLARIDRARLKADLDMGAERNGRRS